MRIGFLLLLGLIIAGNSAAQPTGVKMFRFNPQHLGFATTGKGEIYDTRAWSFDAGAPVRSTPLVDGNLVYFGNTRGDFYALDKKKGRLHWHFRAASAVNSSAAVKEGILYFSDNGQSVYALNKNNGQLLWKTDLGKKIDYPWRFDYYYSSPVLYQNLLLIGGDDGWVHILDAKNGREARKFKASGPVRSTIAIQNGRIFFGDTEGRMKAVDLSTGKEIWQFHTVGDTLKNEDWGFDRRAILSTPVISGRKLIFGSRDGYLYCVNTDSGELLWKMDHRVSWIISTVAIKDSIVVTGTSDGRFVQALNLENGKEIWRFPTHQVVWSSPLIVNDQVYSGDFEGQFYALDLKTGRRISLLQLGDKIMSSPVWEDHLMYLGCDDGHLYALEGRPFVSSPVENNKRFVYYDPQIQSYFRDGSGLRVKNYLAGNGFIPLSTDSLSKVVADLSGAGGSSIVFASLYFPKELLINGKDSPLRKFLDAGGRIVLPGTNPAVFKLDEKTHQPYAFNLPVVDSVFSLSFGSNDTRAFGGLFSSFTTEKGRQMGLCPFWISSFGISANQVDVVLGENENGQATSFCKFYENGGALVQLWIHPDLPSRLDALVKAAEWKIN